jgi:Xaa-Pro aminopeptidase
LCVIKSPREVEMLRRAGLLSALAVREAMRSTKPGAMEYHLAAIASYVFRVNGAREEGYRPIIPGGEGIWCGHYWRNDQPLHDGDLVLMDCAPDTGYYTSDIGRMFPVNGAYSAQQRQLYGFVVAYHKTLLERIRPGVKAAQVMEEAAEAMAPVIEQTAFAKPIYETAARKMLEFQGHLSHPVGMSVHGVGRYRDHPLAPGMVFTVDPQMWIPEEKLYVRCEDTIAVTEEGMENLTALAPLELDAVEEEMQKRGMLEAYPPELE